MKQALVPDATVAVFYEGQHCVNALPGDLILVQHSGFMPVTIRVGQRIRYWARRVIARDARFKKEYCQYNHAMIVVEGGPEARVSQMEAKGGTIVDLLTYVDKKYVVVSPTHVSDEQRIAAARVGKWCEGIAYGWLSIFGMVIDVLIPVVEVSLGSGQRMVCSTASALAHRCVGLIPDHADTSNYPADLARYYDVTL